MCNIYQLLQYLPQVEVIVSHVSHTVLNREVPKVHNPTGSQVLIKCERFGIELDQI